MPTANSTGDLIFARYAAGEKNAFERRIVETSLPVSKPLSRYASASGSIRSAAGVSVSLTRKRYSFLTMNRGHAG